MLLNDLDTVLINYKFMLTLKLRIRTTARHKQLKNSPLKRIGLSSRRKGLITIRRRRPLTRNIIGIYCSDGARRRNEL